MNPLARIACLLWDESVPTIQIYQCNEFPITCINLPCSLSLILQLLFYLFVKIRQYYFIFITLGIKYDDKAIPKGVK